MNLIIEPISSPQTKKKMDYQTRCGWSEYIEDVIMSNKKRIFKEFESEFIEYLREEKGYYIRKLRAESIGQTPKH